jgi:UV DNA damage endonuclease
MDLIYQRSIMKKRIGFACKYLHSNTILTEKQKADIESKYNTKTTTVTWLNKQKKQVAEDRLWQIMVHNINSFKNLVNYVGKLPNELRFVRLSSDCLPVYTHPNWDYFYRKSDTKEWLERNFAELGNIARNLDVRLSFHPGQFCCLASDNPDVVKNSIMEFEYHCDMVRWMGFGKTFQDFKTNVHIGGRLGPEGIRLVYPLLSEVARNTITIENDEFGWGLESCLELSDIIPIVLDIHHHFIRTNGEYILPNDDRFKKCIDSWRGIRPVIHYSSIREEYIKDFTKLPDMPKLLEEGLKPQKLRAHSDTLPIPACNNWALDFWEYADIMTETKNKNLSAIQLYNYYINNYVS